MYSVIIQGIHYFKHSCLAFKCLLISNRVTSASIRFLRSQCYKLSFLQEIATHLAHSD